MEKIKKNKIKFNILSALIIISFCIAITPITLQNDTFYTIKIGETINQNGIDMLDHFSWNENLQYTYPHWLYDLIIYLIYNKFGFLGIYISTCILSSLLGLSIYYCNTKLTKNNVMSFLITLLTMFLMTSYITARAQIVTFILFVFTIYFIEKFLKSGKPFYGILLFIISFLIANIHVAVWPFFFILFLPYIGEEVIINFGDKLVSNCSMIKAYQKDIKKLKDTNANSEKILKYEQEILKLENERKERINNRKNKLNNSYKIILNKNSNVKWLILIMSICVLSGLLTPLGLTPYTYLPKTLLGNSTHYISEHLPTILISNAPILVFLTLFIGILAFTKQKIELKHLFLIGGLIVLSLLSSRQISMLVLLGSFVLTRFSENVLMPNKSKDSEKIINILSNNTISYLYIFMFIFIIIITPLSKNINSSFINEKYYPTQATEYMKTNLDVKNIRLFNEYDFGSYLLLNDIPVFIDSRADLYLPEYNGENCNVFDDFMKVKSGKIYCEEIFEKYKITHIILSKNSLINIEVSGANNGKYIELYSDDYFVIYERI